MTGAIVLDGATLTPDAVRSVARDGTAVELAPAARARNAQARAAIAALLERGEPLYGATTGVGALRDRTIGDADRERFQWNLLRSHAVSAGRPLEPELVRAGMVVRANQLGAGGAGVAPALLDGLVAALNDGITPLTRELGSLGTGDLPALAEIALALLGEGQVWRGGAADRRAGSGRADRARPARRPRLHELGGDERRPGFAGERRRPVASGALARGGGAVVRGARGRSGRARPARAGRSRRARPGRRGRDDARAAGRRAVRSPRPRPPGAGPYPFRVLPQVDGVAHDALDHLDEVLRRELNARPENALIHDGRALPTGNFHAAELVPRSTPCARRSRTRPR